MIGLASWLRRHVVTPLLQAHAPRRQVAWGAGIGMFIALLPMVGQLYVLPPVWAACRYVLGRAFHLPIAYGMVFLINPPLKILTFYLYLLSGDALLAALGHPAMEGGFSAFSTTLLGAEGNWLANSARAAGVALQIFGPPIVVGGVLWAVLGGILAYALARIALARRGRDTRLAAHARAPSAPVESAARSE